MSKHKPSNESWFARVEWADPPPDRSHWEVTALAAALCEARGRSGIVSTTVEQIALDSMVDEDVVRDLLAWFCSRSLLGVAYSPDGSRFVASFTRWQDSPAAWASRRVDVREMAADLERGRALVATMSTRELVSAMSTGEGEGWEW